MRGQLEIDYLALEILLQALEEENKSKPLERKQKIHDICCEAVSKKKRRKKEKEVSD